MQYFMNQYHQQSASWSWSTTVSYLKTERTLWEGHTKGMNDYHYWWETNTSTVNSVNASSIFQTVSYNAPSWGAGPFRVNNFEPGIQQACGGDAQCMQNMRIDEAQLQLGIMSFAVGGEVGILGKTVWEARAARIAAEKLAKALNVPGRVQSRINLKSGDPGWKHVVDEHFNPAKNKSQFTISKSELQALLQSKGVVNTPVTRILNSADGTRYVREVSLGRNIGLDKFNSMQPTSTMTVLSDKFGNLVTATPGLIK